MNSDIITAGVRPGSVTTSDEIMMLISYIFREADQPVTMDQLNEVLQRQELVNYFEFTNAWEKLIHNHIITSCDDHTFILSEDGKGLADTFKKNIPSSIRERAQSALSDVLTLVRRQQENIVRVEKVDDGFQITLIITDVGSDLLRVTMFLPSEQECERVRRRFLNDPSLLYKGNLALLTGDMETVGQLIPSKTNLFD